MEEKGRLWLYENKYKQNDKHPVKTGPGEVPREVLKKIVEKIKATGEDSVKLRCACWERVSKKGNPYTFITFEVEEEKRGAAADDVPF